MQPANRQLGFRGQVSTLAALFTLAVVLACGLLSASPELHRLVHSDADAPDHGCIITMFTKGQLLPTPTVPIFAILALLFGGVSLLVENPVHCPADYRFGSSRAPPRFLV